MKRSPAAGLVMATSLHAFEQMAVVAIMEPIISELGGRGATGLIFGAYLIASILATVWAGGFIDRKGPYLPMILGLTAFAGGLALAAAADSIAILIIARGIQGLGGGMLLTTSFAVVNRGFQEEQRPRILAALSQAWVLPGIIGPPIAGLIEDLIHWRAVFLIILPLVPAVAWLTLPALRRMAWERESSPRETKKGRGEMELSTGNAIILAGGTALLLAASIQGNPRWAVPGAILGLALTGWALVRLLPRGVFRLRPILPAAAGLKFLAVFAFYGPDSYLPMALIETRDQTVFRASLALIPAAVFWALASSVVARIKSPDYARLSRMGVLLLGAGIIILMTTLRGDVPVALALVAWSLAGFGIGLAYISLMALAMREAPPDREGAVGTVMTIADSLGFAFGAGFVGSVLFHFSHVSYTTQFAGAWSVNLAAALLAALLAFRLRR